MRYYIAPTAKAPLSGDEVNVSLLRILSNLYRNKDIPSDSCNVVVTFIAEIVADSLMTFEFENYFWGENIILKS